MKAPAGRGALEDFVRDRAAPTAGGATGGKPKSSPGGLRTPLPLDILVETLLDEQAGITGPASARRLGPHHTTLYKLRSRRDEIRDRAIAEKHPKAGLVLAASEMGAGVSAAGNAAVVPARKPAEIVPDDHVDETEATSSIDPAGIASEEPVADALGASPTEPSAAAPTGSDEVLPEAVFVDVPTDDGSPAPSSVAAPPVSDLPDPDDREAGSIRISVRGAGRLDIRPGAFGENRIGTIGFMLDALLEEAEDVVIDARGAAHEAADAVLGLARRRAGVLDGRRIVLVDDHAVLVLTSRQTAAPLLAMLGGAG